MTKTLKIEVFTDVVCPWCLVGATRLDTALKALPEGVRADVVNHPFYLNPDTPAEGVVVADMLREKYGRDPKEMWARVEGEAAKAGIALDLSQQPRAFPTAKAHTLIRLARDKGTQHELANALTAAYFLEHRQINDDTVLADVAERFGFTRNEAIEAVHDVVELAETAELAIGAAQSGITGVPFFIFDGRFALSGAQPAEVFARAIAMALEPAAEGAA